jgi:hypothetical protein
MKTDALIRALALDAARPVWPVGRIMGVALAAGCTAAGALFLLALRTRPDLSAAFSSSAFCLKLAVTTCLGVTAAAALGQVARPVGRNRALRGLALAPLLLAVGVAAELAEWPVDSWAPRLLGRNAPHCLALIPLLSALPAVLLLWALKRTAPARPGLAGMVAGLTASGIGATLYALTCPDDSPLFVAVWYSIAVVIVSGVCFLIGRRWLRW